MYKVTLLNSDFRTIEMHDDISGAGWFINMAIEFRTPKQRDISWGHIRAIGNISSGLQTDDTFRYDLKPFVLRLPNGNQYYVDKMAIELPIDRVVWHITRAEEIGRGL